MSLRRGPRRRAALGSALIGLLAALLLVPMTVVAYAANPVTVSGTVVDAASGDPIASAWVSVDGGTHEAETDEAGHYQLELEPGSHPFYVAAEGYTPVSTDIVIAESTATIAPIELTALPDPIAVTGTVVDAVSGDPIAEAYVEAYDYFGYQGDSSAQTAQDGSYTLNLRPGTTYSWIVQAAGYADFRTEVEISESTTTIPPFELDALAPGIFVSVHNSTLGASAGNAKVSLTSVSGGFATVHTTDSDGNTTFEDVPNGTYDLTVLEENGYVGGETERFEYEGGYYATSLSTTIDLACKPTSVNPGLTNIGFENGLNGWKLGYQTESIQAVGADQFTAPWEGGSMARLGHPQQSEMDGQPLGPNVMCQDFKVTKAQETFAFNVFTYDYTGFDEFRFDVVVTDPDTGESLAAYGQGAWGSGTALKTSGWRGVRLDLSDHVGETVRLTFRSGGTSDGAYAFWAYVDSAATLPPTVETSDVTLETTTGSVTTDPTTGQLLVSMPSGDPSDLTLTVPASCQGEATPDTVFVLLNGQRFETTSSSAGYHVTIPEESIASGTLSLEVNCSGETTKVAPIGDIVLYDPSGIVRDSVTGDPIVGATVRLHKVPGWTPQGASGPYPDNSCQTNLSKAPGAAWDQPAPTHLGQLVNSASPEISPNVNPFVTNSVGYYGWDVAEGCWYVVVEKEGYETLTSPVVGVPTAVTDLDLKLTRAALSSTEKPVISGAPKVGSVLSATSGSWSSAPTGTSYQWLADGATIAGATSATYTPVGGDVGKKLSVRVTVTRAGYTNGVATSDQTGAVQNAAFVKNANPTVVGTPQVGVALGSTAGSWTPTPTTTTYQWLSNGAVIAGATGASYTPVAGDAGKSLSVRVTVTKAGYADGVATSAQTAAVPHPVVVITNGSKPSLSGVAKVGRKLTTNGGSWIPAEVTKTYQWLRAGRPIAGAAAKRSSYTLVPADRGKRVSVRVTASRAGHTEAVQTSAARRIGFGKISCRTPVRTGKVTVGAFMRVTQKCTTRRTVVRYQWLRNGVAIKRATRASYKVTKADRRKRISVRVIRTKKGYARLVKVTRKSLAVR